MYRSITKANPHSIHRIDVHVYAYTIIHMLPPLNHGNRGERERESEKENDMNRWLWYIMCAKWHRVRVVCAHTPHTHIPKNINHRCNMCLLANDVSTSLVNYDSSLPIHVRWSWRSFEMPVCVCVCTPIRAYVFAGKSNIVCSMSQSELKNEGHRIAVELIILSLSVCQ